MPMDISSLWIVWSHRVVGSGSQAVSGVWWVALERGVQHPNQLNNLTQSISFDRDGNIFVADMGNN